MEKQERVAKILDDFLDRNKNYPIEVYIRSSTSNCIIGQIFVASDRVYKANNEKITLEWDIDCGVKFNRFSIPYDEVMACYEEKDEYESQTFHVIFKSGITLDFECCGMRI